MANPIVSSLPTYVEEHKLPLIAKSILDSKSASLFTLYSGVKGESALNLINTEVVFGDGAECAFSPSGTTTLSQRVLKPSYLKVDMEWCDKNLLKTWANYQVQIAAGAKALPFEEDFVGGVTEGIAEGIEKMIWQGTSANTNECSGMLEILSADLPTGNTVSATGAYATIKAVYMAMPESVVSKEDAVILVGADVFRSYIQDLVTANLYHFNPSDKEGEYKLPATNCKVISVNGLNGTNKVVGARLSNLFYGCDLQTDSETFDLWYSKDNKVFRFASEFMVGVQVAYPNEVIVGTKN